MKQMRVKIPEDLAAALAERARVEAEGNESMVVRRALRAYLEAEEAARVGVAA